MRIYANKQKGETMKATTKATKYARAYVTGGLPATWQMLSKNQKSYARYLVRAYGYPVSIAIQRAYIFGYDVYPYDYRAGTNVPEKLTPAALGFARTFDGAAVNS